MRQCFFMAVLDVKMNIKIALFFIIKKNYLLFCHSISTHLKSFPNVHFSFFLIMSIQIQIIGTIIRQKHSAGIIWISMAMTFNAYYSLSKTVNLHIYLQYLQLRHTLSYPTSDILIPSISCIISLKHAKCPYCDNYTPTGINSFSKYFTTSIPAPSYFSHKTNITCA